MPFLSPLMSTESRFCDPRREKQKQYRLFLCPWLSAYCKSVATYSVDRQYSQQCNFHYNVLCTEIHFGGATGALYFRLYVNLIRQLPVHSQSHAMTLNIGGSRGHAQRTPPLRVQILSFRHTKFLKCNRLGIRRPPYEIVASPTGNPGSATGYPATLLTCHFFSHRTFAVYYPLWYSRLNRKPRNVFRGSATLIVGSWAVSLCLSMGLWVLEHAVHYDFLRLACLPHFKGQTSLILGGIAGKKQYMVGTNKFPWLFPDFSSIFFQFSSIFSVFY